MEVLGPPALAAWIEMRFGAIESAHRLPHATQAAVWRVVLATGTAIAVKHPHSQVTFSQELAAYRQWAPEFGPEVPRLLDYADPPVGALVLEWIEGTPITDLEPDVRRAMHQAAGSFLRRLADVGQNETDPVSLVNAMTLRFENWCRRAVDVVGSELVGEARAKFDASLFAQTTRIFAHRDFSPRNWLCVQDPRPRLVVLDFGHARPDAPLRDLVKLWDRPWVVDPASKAAFFEGFGRHLIDLEYEQLRQHCLMHGLATAVWGVEHKDPEYAALGRSVLGRLGVGSVP